MLRIKQEVKNAWLQDHLVDTKAGNIFPQVVIVEVFEFDDVSASDFDTAIWNAVNSGQTLIPVVVDSFGGQVYSLLRMLDTIAAAKAIGATIVTIGKSKMMSCGSVLVAAGTKGFRYAQPNAAMMIHEVSSSGRGKNMELQSDAAETDRLNTVLLHKLAEFANKPKKYFVDLVHSVGHADLFLSAKEIVALGLIDKVGEPAFSLKIDLAFEILTK